MEVHAEPLNRRYYGEVWSVAFWLKLAIWLTQLILPAYIAYQTKNFWAKEASGLEQPIINFGGGAIIYGYNAGLNAGPAGAATPINSPTQTTQSLVPIVWSSIAAVMSAVGYSGGRQPSIRSSEIDLNHDSRTDRINITLVVPKRTDINHLDLFLPFQLTLTQVVALEMQSALILSASDAQSLSAVHISGDLLFEQRAPIPVVTTRSVYNTPIIDPTNVTSANDILLTTISDKIQARNESISLGRASYVWTGNGQFVDHFIVYVSLNVPTQSIRYTPGLGEVIKFSSIQYFVIYAILWWILNTLQSALHTAQILDVGVTDDTAPVGRPFVNY